MMKKIRPKWIPFSALLFLVFCCDKPKSFKTQEEKLEMLANVDYAVSEDYSALISNNKSSKKIKIDINDYVRKGYNISEISKATNYVVLETSDSSLIGDIDEMYVVENDWVLSDADISKTVYRFHSDGRLKAIIGKYGQGPGEFLNPTNISIDNDLVYVHSEDQGVVLVYNGNGDFIKDFKVPFLFDDFHYVEDEFIFNTSNRINGHIAPIANYMLVTTNDILSIEHGGVYFDPDFWMKVRTGFSNQLIKNKGEIIYIQPFSADINQIDIKTLTINKLYELDFGDEWPDSKYLQRLVDRNPVNLRQQLQQDRKVVIESYLADDSYIFLKVLYDYRLIKLIISRSTGEVSGGVALVDDIDNISSIEPRFLLDGKLISLIEPPKLIDILQQWGKSERYENLLRKIPSLESIGSNDNFILRIDHLK